MYYFITRRVGHTSFYWDADRGAFVPNPLAASIYYHPYVAACVASTLRANVIRYVPTQPQKVEESP